MNNKRIFWFALFLFMSMYMLADIDPSVKNRAENGDADAQVKVAKMYADDGNLTEAFKWLQKAGEKNHPEAFYHLGQYYYIGQGNINKAIEYYNKAIDLGYIDAYQNAGLALKDNHQIDKAIAYWKKGAELGVAYCYHDLGLVYRNGVQGINVDYNLAMYYFQKEAERKDADPDEYIYIGDIYYKLEDWDKAISFYKKTLDKGDATALYEMARGYEAKGDYQTAVDYFQKGVDLKVMNCEYALGYHYFFGEIGLNAQPSKGIELMERAAVKGHTDAWINLADIYADKNLGFTDYRKAFLYYSKAADAGKSLGLRGLGDCYMNGIGCAKNANKALELYEQADKIVDDNGFFQQLTPVKNIEYGDLSLNKPDKKRKQKENSTTTISEHRTDSYEDNNPSPSWWLGPRFGIGFSTQKISSGDKMNNGVSYTGGLSTGRFFNKNRNFRIGAELCLQWVSLSVKEKETNTDMTLNYLQVPLNLIFNVRLSKSFSWDIFGGGYVGTGLNSKMKVDGDVYDIDLFKETYEKLDYGCQFGTGLRIKALYIGINYAVGLANAARKEDHPVEYKVNNSNASIILGLYFN